MNSLNKIQKIVVDIALVLLVTLGLVTPQQGLAFANVGIDQNVHFANAGSQDVYVIAAPNPDWAIADLGIDVALLAVGVGELKTVLTTAALPETIKTFSDLYKVLKVSAQLLNGTASSGSNSSGIARSLIEQVKREFPNQKISPMKEKNIRSQGFLSTYLNASGIAGMAGASTVTIVGFTGDGKATIKYNTPPDQSWISSDQGVGVAKYGKIWEPAGGITYYWKK